MLKARVNKLLRLNLMKTSIIASFGLLLTSFVYGSEENLRFVKKFQISGSAEVVVVAEGDFEPRSTGSYSLRVYGGTSKKFPTDNFIAGLVRPRNGIVEGVRFDDVDDDDQPEIVVIVRAVGSGGYVSADAFRYRTRSLEYIASVSELDKKADPIQALRDKIKVSNGTRSSPRLSSAARVILTSVRDASFTLLD